MKTGLIYIHKNKTNGKVYVGSTIQKPNRRWRKNTINSYKSCPAFYNALKLYGWDKFETLILEENIPFNELSLKEETYILQFNSLAPNGYNTNEFIEGRVRTLIKTRKKMSESKKEYYKSLVEPIIAFNRKEYKIIENIEHKHCTMCDNYLVLTEFSKCNDNWNKLMLYCRSCWSNYNKKYRKKLSKEEFKESYRARTEKMRKSILDNYINNPEIKQKLSESKSKPIKGINIITGEIIRFKSGLEAKANGFNNTGIKRSIDKNQPYKEYKWFYEKKEGRLDKYLIFPHELVDPIKSAIWLSIQNSNKNVIYARDCEIKHLDNKTQRDFMKTHHLQGSVEAKVKYGLFYQNNLVSVMTFGKPRYNKKYEWELLRFCSLINTRVIGGASKLFKFFIKNHSPKNVISYANLRFSEGNMYEKLGFNKIGKSSPNYFYIKDNVIYSRIRFQKHKLKDMIVTFDPNLSEKVNMINNGYQLLYDRGNLIYEWSND